MESDAHQLVEGACQGDQAAARRLIELFYERIYAFLRRLTGSEAEAADLTQRVFERVWKALPSFAGRSSVGSWLHGIAYHIYVDWRRSDHRTEARSDEWWASCPAPQMAPDEMAIRKDLAATLYAAADQLLPDLREAIHLHYYQGLTLQETAEAMDIATSTVKYRLRQAVTELQKQLADRTTPLTPSNSKVL